MAGISESVVTFRSAPEGYVPVLTIPPDGGYGWVIVGIGFIGSLIFDGLCSSFYLFREAIAKDLGVTTLETAVIGSIYGSIMLFMGPPVSGLCNIYGFRVIMMIGSVFAVAGFGCSYFATSITHLICLHGLLAGIGMGFLMIPIMVPVNYWFDHRRPIALGLASSGSGIGTVIIPATLSYVLDDHPWQFGVLIEAGCSSAFFFISFFLRSQVPVKLEFEGAQGGSVIVPKLMNPVSQSGLNLITREPEQRGSAILVRQGTGRIQDYRRRRQLSMPSTFPPPHSSSKKFKTWLTSCKCCPKKEVGDRPMYRDDIFYAGSLQRMRSAYSMDPLMYSMSVARLPTQRDLDQEGKWACCPEAVTNVIKRMLNCSLLKDQAFMVIAISTLFHIMGASIPTLYIARWCSAHGIRDDFIKWMVPSIGIGSFFGRLSGGIILQEIPKVDALSLSVILNILFVVATLMVSHMPYYEFMFPYAVTVGFCTGLFLPLRNLIMVDYIGLERLTTGSGLNFAFMGVSVLICGPLAELVSGDKEGERHLLTAYMAVGFVTLGTLINLQLIRLKKFEA